MRIARLTALALLLPVLAEEGIRDFQAEPGEGEVRLSGRVELADLSLITLSLLHQRSDLNGPQWKLLDRVQVRVKDGAFDKTLRQPGGLPFGPYKVEAEYERERQRPGVPVAKAGIHAELAFKMDFRKDITVPVRERLESYCTVQRLWKDLEAAYQPLYARVQGPWTRIALAKAQHKDPDPEDLKTLAEAAEAWSRFAAPFDPLLVKAWERLAMKEDLLFPFTSMRLWATAKKVRLYRKDHESMITTGQPCKERVDHPEWFVPDPEAEAPRIRGFLAREFPFNVSKKVVDYGYDKGTEILKRGRGWERFRDSLSPDLDRMETCCSDLLSDPCKEEMAKRGPATRKLIQAGRLMLAAGDRITADAAEGKSGPGALLLEEAKVKLKAAHSALQSELASPPP